MTAGPAERDMADTLAEQEWLDPVDNALGQAVRGAFEAGGDTGRQAQNFLHGTWLGHPLHPVLTDLPIGAWTTAMALDTLDVLTGRNDLAPGADAAIGFGLVAAVPTALAGLTDWHVSDGQARKVGLVHGLLNIAVAGLYGVSFVCRKRGERALGQTLSLTAFAIANYAAYLGGDLVYRERLGVDHSADQELPEEFTPVLANADLPEGQLRRGEADGAGVLLVRQGGQIYALSDSCGHLGCSLAEGKLEGDSVRCTCHGSRYALADGRVLDGPSTFPQPVFVSRVRHGQIEVRVDQQ